MDTLAKNAGFVNDVYLAFTALSVAITRPGYLTKKPIF